ncbi:hypothetical protein [Albibacillus kandeliae]|uniref:hypothetical protein n=1 Tax=Albibacillus kandeliae TaxID=2174228 RepID=UPI000D695921|nr:hypothetical protein [Albibacillus kandeliae]
MLKLIIGLLIGLIIGGVGGVTLAGGGMMGAGVATGLATGICATVQAAQKEGIMTPEQVDQVLSRAAADLGAQMDELSEADTAGSADQCAAFMSKLGQGA